MNCATFWICSGRTGFTGLSAPAASDYDCRRGAPIQFSARAIGTPPAAANRTPTEICASNAAGARLCPQGQPPRVESSEAAGLNSLLRLGCDTAALRFIFRRKRGDESQIKEKLEPPHVVSCEVVAPHKMPQQSTHSAGQAMRGVIQTAARSGLLILIFFVILISGPEGLRKRLRLRLRTGMGSGSSNHTRQ